MSGRRSFALALVCASVMSLWASAAAAAPARRPVTVRQLRWAGLQINVADVRRGGRVIMKVKQANGSVTSLQPVVQMCRHCVVGLNGDFFEPATRQPIGGVIIGGVVLRSPNPSQNQLTFEPNGQITAGPMRWLGQLSAGDLAMPVAVNDPNAASPVLYDRHYGRTTPPGPAMELAFVLNPSTLHLGRAIHLSPRGPHAPGSVIPPGQVVLRAPAAFVPQMHELQTLLRAEQPAVVRLGTDPMAKNSLGANHVLLKGGRLVPIGENDAFVNGTNPRTLFGWDAHGHVSMVTIGSAVPGHRGGVSLPVAARLMQSLGVTNAVNLDGGGSSTFVSRGHVLNHPSDGVVRPVTNAWLVVPRPRPAHKHAAAKARASVVHRRRIARRSHARARPAPAHVPPPTTNPVIAPPSPPPSTSTTTTTPASVRARAGRRLAERRLDLRATASRARQRSRLHAAAAPAAATDHELLFDDPLFDALLVLAVVLFGLATTSVRRRQRLRARPRRHGA
jgi:hypothetical protein